MTDTPACELGIEKSCENFGDHRSSDSSRVRESLRRADTDLSRLHPTLSMGIGRRQKAFFETNLKHRFEHGGIRRSERAGRKQRPLSTKDYLHLVFKINRNKLRSRSLRTHKPFLLVTKVIQQYSKRFFVKIDHLSIQGDHIHLLVRAPRRALYHHFHRVVAGQIAQRLEHAGQIRVTDTPGNTQRGTKLWKFRPFTRIVRGFRDYLTVRNYIQLNEKEALGEIPYRTERLRGMSTRDWEILWA